ncbi:MAG: peptidase E [Chloroflexota bacterium]
MSDQHIIALGGGGFSDGNGITAIDRYVIALTGKARPKVCFLGQASAEHPDYVLRFMTAYAAAGADPSWFTLFRSIDRNYRETILAQDIIYVGGGNTKSMLAIWRDWGMDVVLKEALGKGVILTGVSAGAICWFEQAVTDSYAPIGVIDSLGWLSGSACPHYGGEAERRPSVARLMSAGELGAGIAIDNDCAVHYMNGELHKVISERDDAAAYAISWDGETVVEEKMDVKIVT